MNYNRPPSITNQLRGAAQESAQLAGYVAFDAGAWGVTIPLNTFRLARKAVRNTVGTINYIRSMPSQPAYVSVESVLEVSRSPEARRRRAEERIKQARQTVAANADTAGADYEVLWVKEELDSYEVDGGRIVKKVLDRATQTQHRHPVDLDTFETASFALENAAERIPQLAA